MSARNWPIPTSASDFFQQSDKRMMHQERRPAVRTASDILGPGAGPFSVVTLDWNSDECVFTGSFYSEPGAANAPDGVNWWIGNTFGTPDGFGFQVVWDFQGVTDPPVQKRRRFSTPSGGGPRTYSLWM